MKRAILTAAAVVALALAGSGTVSASPPDQHQVVVCKYVGTPGVDERLQTGQNPIVVDSHSLLGAGFAGTFPFAFSDAQGQSIAIRFAVNSHDGDISECPGYVAPSEEPTPSATPSDSASPTPSATPSPKPSESPTALVIPTPSSEPTSTPSESPTTSIGPKLPVATPPATDAASEDAAQRADDNGAAFIFALLLMVTMISMFLLSPRRMPRR